MNKNNKHVQVVTTILLLLSSNYCASLKSPDLSFTVNHIKQKSVDTEIKRTMQYKAPDFSKLNSMLLPLPTKDKSLQIYNPRCLVAFKTLKDLDIKSPQFEDQNIIQAISSFYEHKKAYKQWIDTCLGPYHTLDIIIVKDLRYLLLYNIEILFNEVAFGGLITKLERVVKMIYVDKELNGEKDIELVQNTEISSFNMTSESILRQLIESKNELLETYEKEKSMKFKTIKGEDLASDKIYEQAFMQIVIFVHCVTMLESPILLQLHTHLFDITISTEINLLQSVNVNFDERIKFKVRDIFKNSNVFDSLNGILLNKRSEESVEQLYSMLDYIRLIDRLDKDNSANEKVNNSKKIRDQIQLTTDLTSGLFLNTENIN